MPEPTRIEPTPPIGAGRPPPPTRRLTIEAPELIVTGDDDARDHVMRALSSLAVTLVGVGDLDTVRARIGPRTRGVVLVLPLPQAEPRQALMAVRTDGSHRQLPVFVVVPEDYPAYGAHKLYDAGAAAVFEWPGEVLLLPRVVREMLGVGATAGHEGDADDGLEQAVNTRLRLADRIGDDIVASVEGGVARVRGRVESLWQRQRIRNLLEHVPGIKAVHSEELEVRPPERADDDLSAHVAELVACVPGVDRETISVSVHEGRVELAGSVASRGRLERLVDVLGNVAGVKEIHNHVVVTRKGAKRSANLARALRAAVRALHPEADVDVAVFGSVAVLTGHVPVLALRTEIERQMRRRDEIDRVVNKIVVP